MTLYLRFIHISILFLSSEFTHPQNNPANPETQFFKERSDPVMSGGVKILKTSGKQFLLNGIRLI
jgi:hypothetical protein